MTYLDPLERANRAAVLLGKERYNLQLAPFVRNSSERLRYVRAEIDRLIDECSKELGADREYVKSHLEPIIADAVAVTEPPHEELKYKNTDKGTPPEGESPTDPMADAENFVRTDVMDHDVVLEETATEVDAVVDLGKTADATIEELAESFDTEVSEEVEDSGDSDIQAQIDRLEGDIATAEGVDEEGGKVAGDELESMYAELGRLYMQLNETEGEEEVESKTASVKICCRCQENEVDDSPVCQPCTDELLEQSEEKEAATPLDAQPMGPADPNTLMECKVEGCGFTGTADQVAEHIREAHLDQGQNSVDTTTTISPYKARMKEALTKKDFVAIAAMLRDTGADSELIGKFADYLATQNPRFDRERFIDAASPEAAVEESEVESSVKEAEGEQPERQEPVESPPEQNLPHDRFEDMVQNLADRAAAREFSQPDEDEIRAIAEQLNIDEEEVRANVRGTATFGEFTGVDGELGSEEFGEDYQEVLVDGVGGHVSAHEALVPVDAVLQKVADEMGMEQQLVYDMVKDRYGGVDLPDKYHASVSGEHRFYLPASLLTLQEPVVDEQVEEEVPA